MSFLVGIVTVAGRTAFSPLGRRLACGQQMSYSGRNFDILTGVTAIAVAAFTYRPFVWLPAVMVASVLAGHLVAFRAGLQPWTRPGANSVDANGRPV